MHIHSSTVIISSLSFVIIFMWVAIISNAFVFDWLISSKCSYSLHLHLPSTPAGMRKHDNRFLRRPFRADWVYSDKIVPKHLWLSLKFFLIIFMTFIKIFQNDMLKIKAASYIKQKGHFFFEGANTKNFIALYSLPFLSGLHQNEALHNFYKREQRLIVECIKSPY